MKTALLICFALQFTCSFSQDIHFEKVLDGSLMGIQYITGISQDKQGYVWLSTSKGLYRYDGSSFKSFLNQTGNEDALLQNNLSCFTIDSTGIIWIGTHNAGIKKFNPVTNAFTSFKHNSQDASSLINDTIWCIMTDHSNNIWIGTKNSLDKLDKISGKFIHYAIDKKNTSGLNTNIVKDIYEDKQNTIWVCYDFFAGNNFEKAFGGLYQFDPVTAKFTYYFNGRNANGKFVNDVVMSIFEDNKENLWIGMGKNELQVLTRKTGKFVSFPYLAIYKKPDTSIVDAVSFINEDKLGYIWAGTYTHGLIRYDLSLNKKMHYGSIFNAGGVTYLNQDTLSGFNEISAVSGFCSKDGTFWVATSTGNLYKAIFPHANIPYFNMESGANSFYEQNDSILWIATSVKGLDRRNINTAKDTWITNKNGNQNIPPDHDVLGLRADAYSNLWIGTYTGLYKLNLKSNFFSRFPHDNANNNSPANDTIQCLHTDKQNLWMGTYGYGLDKMNITNRNYEHFTNNKNDSNSIINNTINCITEDKKNGIWIGTLKGVDRLNQRTNKFTHYLKQLEVLSICIDSKDQVWVGTTEGFYYFDSIKKTFVEYSNYNSPIKIANVLHILEDNQQNLWLTTDNSIIKIDRQHNTVYAFGKNYGYHNNNFYTCDNYKLANGQLVIGDQNGYYLINPSNVHISSSVFLNFTSFKINDKEIQPAQGSVLTAAIWLTKEISLNYKQNTFSLDFIATDYANNGETKYAYMLENYDNTWRDIGTEHNAYFFNVPTGKYIFHAKAINPDGIWVEKSISIIISPPWWRTWWAYTFYPILFIVASFIANRVIRRRILEQEYSKNREKELKHAREIEKAYHELKSTQAQLIQSEKMASLGELTAGIAHEIQNPLNFVNNFSEVSAELIEEMNIDLNNGDIYEAKEIALDLKQNLEKINHHGKRAGDIVKGMLQHSRASTGVREPTDINALADEYLRLSYHGLRAKDKSFNATMKTDFDGSIGKINIIPQDIGRVLLNLYNNAFYACTERSRSTVNEQKNKNLISYEPKVSVTTKKSENHVIITVSDNGNGIPQKIVDKIFQPFFTTKPTGQGTGLGLSLSYDIVKAHGGEIKVISTEGFGSEFIVYLPLKNEA